MQVDDTKSRTTSMCTTIVTGLYCDWVDPVNRPDSMKQRSFKQYRSSNTIQALQKQRPDNATFLPWMSITKKNAEIKPAATTEGTHLHLTTHVDELTQVDVMRDKQKSSIATPAIALRYFVFILSGPSIAQCAWASSLISASSITMRNVFDSSSQISSASASSAKAFFLHRNAPINSSRR